jgi:hypothetical protein
VILSSPEGARKLDPVNGLPRGPRLDALSKK